MSETADTCDVFIVGGGIAACTFARILVDAKLHVIMADAGAQHSLRAGENLKNFKTNQEDVAQYGGTVRGLLFPASKRPADPSYTHNALNPHQAEDKLEGNHLPAAVVAYAVGGMAIHWTCAIPRFDASEMIGFPKDIDWSNLYQSAEGRLNLHIDVHEPSARHQVLRRVLVDSGFKFENTPLAAQRINEEYVHYTGADTVLGDLAEPGHNGLLTILREHRVTELRHNGTGVVQSVLVRNLREKKDKVIHAKWFIVAAGWVHTAQVLHKSGIYTHKGSALGRYLTDHTFTSCQVVLKKEIVELIAEEAGTLGSPLPIPRNDPPPHLHVKVSQEHPWHSMIFREAFQFDPLTPDVDERLIVDLKWFGIIDPNEDNHMTFERDVSDRIGMPQPTFHFTLGQDDKDREHKMLIDMQNVAYRLGNYLPGSEAKRVPLGTATHTMGATRMGEDKSTSVVDSYSKVWDTDNLYVGGNCVIPTANASNPTLTTIALAIRSAEEIVRRATGKVLAQTTS